MNWIKATLAFSPSLPIEDFASIITDHYSVDASVGEYEIEDALVTLSFAAGRTMMPAVFPDDNPLTMFRRARLSDEGNYGAEVSEDGETIIRQTIFAWWNPALISDLQSDSKPEWLEGIEIL